MRLLEFLACVLFTGVVSTADEIDFKHLQCLVCRSSMEEIVNELSKIDPKRKIELGNGRFDHEGNVIKKKVPMAQSEIHISETLDKICEKMSDYVRATYVSNGRLTIMKLVTPGGGMNPEMGKVNIIQDGDLNKSLQYYCEEIVEEHHDSIVELIRGGKGDVIGKVCTEATKICDESMPSDEDDEDDEDDAEDENDVSTDKTEL